MASAALPPPPPPTPLLALALTLALLLVAAAPAPAHAAHMRAAVDAAEEEAAEALGGGGGGEAAGAAPALLARLRAWETAGHPSAPASLLLGGTDDLDAQEEAEAAAAAEAAEAAAAAALGSRVKRTGAQSLSIVAPLDVLRQRLMNELNRRRMRELQGSRIQQNRQLLTSIGKRMGPRLPAPVDLWGGWGERLAAEQA